LQISLKLICGLAKIINFYKHESPSGLGIKHYKNCHGQI